MVAKDRAEFWLCYRALGDDCDVARMVDEARAAVVRDTAARALRAGFRRVRLFSTAELDGLTVTRTRPEQTVGDIVSEAAANLDVAVCYAGGGMPVMTSEDWSEVLEIVENGLTVSNRMFSCDWVGVPSGRMLSVMKREEVDNRFALRVRDQCSVEVLQFERTARSLLDVDTPTDLAVLSSCVAAGSLQIGSRLAEVLDDWAALLRPAVERAVDVFETMTRRDAELMVSGRVSGTDWSVVDRDTSCRVRVISEERGLSMRKGRGRSLLAALYESVGVDAFVNVLSGMSDSMIWDTRPFCSHLGWELSRADRFWADLGHWDAISHKPLSELARRLERHRVLTGGHSLVSGGLLAAIDAAWTRRELSG